MAVYFPGGQQSFDVIKKKFIEDLRGIKPNKADGMVFVTNQELRLAERETLQKAAGTVGVALFHLEKITAILDQPEMVGIRKQFLGIDFTDQEKHGSSILIMDLSMNLAHQSGVNEVRWRLETNAYS
jgi:hypothetical protein